MSMLDFIRRERIYIWMALFVIAVNLLLIGHPHKKSQEPASRKSISAQTFKNMGITENKVRLFFESRSLKSVFFKYSFMFGFFILMAGIVMNLIFLLGKKEIIPKGIPAGKPVLWGISDIVRIGVIVVFAGYMLSAISALAHFNADLNLRMILGTFFIDITAGAAILYFALVKYKEKLSSLGLGIFDFYKNVFSGITAYIFMLPVLITALILSMLILNVLGYKPPSQPVFDMFFEEKRSSVILFLAVFVSVLGPVIEEIFFRGFLYNAVKKRFGILSGALLSGALFSILHTNIVGFLPILILGILMAFLYETTGSLVASMSVHILHNSIIVYFVFFIKELLK